MTIRDLLEITEEGQQIRIYNADKVESFLFEISNPARYDDAPIDSPDKAYSQKLLTTKIKRIEPGSLSLKIYI